MIDKFLLIKDIVKVAFCFEKDGNKPRKLIYNPFMYEYFRENNIDFKKDLLDILVRTKFKTPDLAKVIE